MHVHVIDNLSWNCSPGLLSGSSSLLSLSVALCACLSTLVALSQCFLALRFSIFTAVPASIFRFLDDVGVDALTSPVGCWPRLSNNTFNTQRDVNRSQRYDAKVSWFKLGCTAQTGLIKRVGGVEGHVHYTHPQGFFNYTPIKTLTFRRPTTVLSVARHDLTRSALLGINTALLGVNTELLNNTRSLILVTRFLHCIFRRERHKSSSKTVT